MFGFRPWVIAIVLSSFVLRGVVTVHKIFADVATWRVQHETAVKFATWMAGPESREIARGLGPFPY